MLLSCWRLPASITSRVLTDTEGLAFGIFALDIFDDLLHVASAIWAAIAACLSRNASSAFLLYFGLLYFAVWSHGGWSRVPAISTSALSIMVGRACRWGSRFWPTCRILRWVALPLASSLFFASDVGIMSHVIQFITRWFKRLFFSVSHRIAGDGNPRGID